MNRGIWERYSKTLTQLGVTNTDLVLEVVDDCLTGPRYRHVRNTVVYDFILPDTINIRWGGEDTILLLTYLTWEFEEGKGTVHSSYTPTLMYEGLEYVGMSEQLVKNVCQGGKRGVIKLNGPWCNERSQILLFHRMRSDPTEMWWDDYYKSVNDFIR
jgi:hypothetical protein